MKVPSSESLRELFERLDSLGYQSLARFPLFTARHWSWRRESRAIRRYREGLDNICEVAVPRLYWPSSRSRLGRLFRFLTLGCPDPELCQEPLWASLGPTQGRLDWLVIPRGGRYILCNHPALDGEDYVYFGDDTLFLMEKTRALLAQGAGSRVLDLCCGGGGVSLGLFPFGGQVTGVDLNPRAVKLAANCAAAYGLENYCYLEADVRTCLRSQRFDLIVGNPPTLSPALTRRPAFHATGDLPLFLEILESVLVALEPTGRALFTVFSRVEATGTDETVHRTAELLKGRRGFRFSLRREFPLGGGSRLRHLALTLLPEEEGQVQELELGSTGFSLPALEWRRHPL